MLSWEERKKMFEKGGATSKSLNCKIVIQLRYRKTFGEQAS